MISVNSPLVTVPVAAFVVTLIVVGALNRKRRGRHGVPLPPGPPAGWFWESVLPKANISATFNEWTDKYGPVITLHHGSKISIVITRASAIEEIMEKEGIALADRPPMIAAGEILSGGKRMVLTSSGDRLRRYKKIIHAYLQPKAVETYKDIQLEQARVLMLGLIDDPKNYQKLAHQYATSVVLRITYGRSGPSSIDDPAFSGVKQVLAHFNAAMRPGAYLVDRFPWLKYLPGYGRRLKEHHISDLKFYGEQLDRVRRSISSGDAGPSFSRTMLESAQEYQFSFDEMAYLAGALFEAGSDTSANAVIAMTMAAACFPEAQLRVQKELDQVIGKDRLPSFGDWDDLPQLHAFIWETLRWRPVAPLGLPHRSSRDIIWKGYVIPAGTTVQGNHWSISRDPSIFPDPERFDPQRWLDEKGKLRTDMSIDFFTFGFGRRACAGMYFANRTLFIGVASLLWAFQVAERPEAPIDPRPDSDNLLSHFPPFQVKFVPRIEEARLRDMVQAV